jgi:ribonuclease T2
MIRAFAFLVAALACVAPALAQQPTRPGAFDYYLLALTWSPAFCAAHGNADAVRTQCARPRGFVVHGLWPQNDDGTWPAYCRAVPPVPSQLAARQLSVMPSRQLIQHEWDKHGSCTVQAADGYFGALDRVFAALHIPDRLRRPTAEYAAPAAEVKRAFAAENPGLAADMMALECAQGDDRVVELRVCLDKALRYRSCGARVVDTCPADVRFAPLGAAAH